MDWTLAIEKNREALKRILAMLVAMAALPVFLRACGDAAGPHPEVQADPEPVEGELVEGEPRRTLPRHLHRAILRLLRPAESGARRLIIVMARGLVVALPPPRPRKAKPLPTILRKPGGTGILMPRGSLPGAPAPRTLALPLLDSLRPFRPRPKRPARSGMPGISLPGITAPFPIALRRPPAPDDPLDATRLALRLQALGAALDDLPRQARRFARWRAARVAGRTRRVWPLRPGRPPGQRRPNRRTHEVYEILNDLHGLAFDVLEHPDTS
jgi:hypothetical protein